MKFIRSFYKPWVGFSLNFALSFSVMTHNSSEIFQLKHYMLWTKTAHQRTTFQTFECFNESSPSCSCHFWNHKVKFYSNFTSLFSVMKITSLYFFSSKYFGQKSPSKWNFQPFQWLIEHSPISSWYIWNQKSVFLWTLDHSLMSLEITLVYYFNWNFISFGQKEHIKVQNFRLLTPHVKFHQICTWIGPFFLKVYKISAKKVHRSCLMTKFEEKFEEKLTCGLENSMRNLANFQQSTLMKFFCPK